MLRTAELEYELPPELIATRAAEPRDSARMLVVSRSDAGLLRDSTVRELPGFLRAGDLLVFNATRVVPARLAGRRADTGGRVEGLYLREEAAREGGAAWVVLLRGRHLRPGVRVALDDAQGVPTGVVLTLLGRDEGEPGAWVVAVEGSGDAGAGVLERVGATPLPPYILKMRRAAGMEVADREDRERYQTVFARGGAEGGESEGSVAAPTAGLHFTPGLLGALAARGVGRAEVVLHVGTGTFKPVEAEHVEEHPMHAEVCSMDAGAVEAVKRTRAAGGRVFAVGTTAVRTLESYAALDEAGEALPERMATRLLITPGYRWRWVDGVVTNFHLPRSTLLALVGALFSGGSGRAGDVERVREVYAHAVRERYRFYSYGDAMLVLP